MRDGTEGILSVIPNWHNGHVSPVTLLADAASARAEDSDSILDVRMGGYLPDGVRRDVPVLALPIFGMSHPTVEVHVNAIAEYQAMFPLFKLVILTDMNLFSIVRPYRWPIEHVMSEDSWERLGIERPWSSYLIERYRQMASMYGVEALIGLNEEHGSPGLLEELAAVVRERGTVPTHIVSAAQATPSVGERWSWRGWLPAEGAEDLENVRVVTPSASCVINVRGMRDASRIAIIDLPAHAQGEIAGLEDVLLRDGWGVAALRFDSRSDCSSRILAYRSVSAAYPAREVSVLLSPRDELNRVPRYRVPDVDVMFTIDGRGLPNVSTGFPGYRDLAPSGKFDPEEVAKFAVAVRAARAIQQVGQ